MSWDALQLGLPQNAVTDDRLEYEGKAQLYMDQAENENLNIM
jgi:hypothetical protein